MPLGNNSKSMPIYSYKNKSKKGCKYCKDGFELMRKVSDEPLEKCPKCGASVSKVLGSFSFGFSKSGLDRRAKDKGFHKLKKVDKGKYEKMY